MLATLLHPDLIGADPFRLVGGVVTALGFIAAGTIFRPEGQRVEGLTTATSLLFSGGIGVCAKTAAVVAGRRRDPAGVVVLRGLQTLEARIEANAKGRDKNRGNPRGFVTFWYGFFGQRELVFRRCCIAQDACENRMKPLKILTVAAAITLALATVADSAFARPGGGGGGGRGGGYHGGGHYHGGHGHYRGSFGFWGGGFWGPGYWGAGYWPGYWGTGYWWPGYWGPGWGGYYGAPAIAYTPFVTQERVWVESDAAGAAPPPAAAPSPNPNAQQWWYWCVSARNYYPYVSSCAEGWQRVAPQPTPSAQ